MEIAKFIDRVRKDGKRHITRQYILTQGYSSKDISQAVKDGHLEPMYRKSVQEESKAKGIDVSGFYNIK